MADHICADHLANTWHHTEDSYDEFIVEGEAVCTVCACYFYWQEGKWSQG